MSREMIRLSRPYLSETSLQQVLDVLDSGMLVQGKWVRAFEEQLEAYLNIPHCILVSNGTAALHLSLLAAGIGPGDEILVPAYTFTAVANAVELTGATPVFADISLADCCLDISQVESKITPSTKAIIAVHEFGMMCDMEGIEIIANKHKLLIIEDAACALGASYLNHKAGTIGYTGCFSFHPRKIITTGEGGAIVTKDAALADRLRKMRNHGIDLSGLFPDFVLPGFNYRMTDFQAALGPEQLAVLDELIDENNRQAAYYEKAFREVEGVQLPKAIANGVVTYQTYHIIFENTLKRDQVKAALKEEGIESNIGAYAIPELKYYKDKYKISEVACPNAHKAYKNGLAIPLGIHLGEEDQDRIIAIVKSIVCDGNG